MEDIIRGDLESAVKKLNMKFDLEGFLGKSSKGIVKEFFSDLGAENMKYAVPALAMSDYDETSYQHMLRTCVLSWANYRFLKNEGFGFENEASMPEFMLAALYHDIGKAMVNSKTLKKPGCLTDDEWEEMKHHPENGAFLIEQIFKGEKIPTGFMKSAAKYHHENLNGNGYEGIIDKKKFTEQLQIIAIADTFDAAYLRGGYQSAVGREDLSKYIDLSCTDAKSNPEKAEYLTKELRKLKRGGNDGKQVPVFKNLEAGKYSPRVGWPFIALLQYHSREAKR